MTVIDTTPVVPVQTRSERPWSFDPDDFERDPRKYDIPDSVIGFMAGELGDLPGGWPEPFRSKVLEGRDVDVSVKPLAPEQAERLQTPGADRQHALNELLFPGPTKAFDESRAQYGDLSVVDTIDYLYGMQAGEEHHVGIGRGVTLNVELEAVGEPDDDGMVTVMTVLGGQLRPVYVRDRSVKVDKPQAEKADASVPGQVAAPFAGAVTIKVAEGDTLAAGDAVATIEAMKMEAAITTPVAGTVQRLALTGTTPVEAGDLIAVVQPA